jgi:hypothetical protein
LAQEGAKTRRSTTPAGREANLDRPLDDLHRGNVLGAIHAFTLENDLDIGIAIIAVGHIDKRLNPTVRSSPAWLIIKIHA